MKLNVPSLSFPVKKSSSVKYLCSWLVSPRPQLKKPKLLPAEVKVLVAAKAVVDETLVAGVGVVAGAEVVGAVAVVP